MSELMEQHTRWVEARARMGAPPPVAAKPIRRKLLSPFSPERNPPPPAVIDTPVNFYALPSWRFIANLCALSGGTTVPEIISPDRTLNITLARHRAAYLIRTHMGLSLTKIGLLFNRDHTSILNSIRVIERSAHQPYHGKHSWTPERNATLRSMWTRGDTSPQIAKALGTTGRAVRTHLARLGIPKRDGTKRVIPKSTKIVGISAELFRGIYVTPKQRSASGVDSQD